jgi:hypothetical protein
MTLVERLNSAELPFGNITVPGMRALDDPAEPHLYDGAGVGKGHVDGMIAASDRAILIDLAEVGFVVEENAAVSNLAQAHDGVALVETQP